MAKLKLQPDPTFWANVNIVVAGQITPAQIQVRFKWMDGDKLKAFASRFADGSAPDMDLAEIIEDWKNVDKEYSVNALQELFTNYPTSSAAILDAYRRELTEGRRKN